jgi:tetratricopeptide (TPR) repeat protein
MAAITSARLRRHDRKIARVSAAAIGCALLLLTGCPTYKGNPDKSAKRLDIAKDALSKQDLETAESEANKAIALFHGNDEAFNILGLIHFVRATRMITTLEVNDCMTGVDSEAMHQGLDEQLVEADKDFEQAAKISPDYGEAWFNRGTIAILQENPEQAIVYLDRALEHPARLIDVALTRAHLGWAHFYTHNYVESAKQLLEALQFHPGMCIATYRLGRVYFAREEWEKAAEQFQGVTDDPTCGNSQEASLFLMKARIEQGLLDDAKVARDACIQMAPKSCLAAQCRTAEL